MVVCQGLLQKTDGGVTADITKRLHGLLPNRKIVIVQCGSYRSRCLLSPDFGHGDNGGLPHLFRFDFECLFENLHGRVPPDDTERLHCFLSAFLPSQFN